MIEVDNIRIAKRFCHDIRTEELGSDFFEEVARRAQKQIEDFPLLFTRAVVELRARGGVNEGADEGERWSRFLREDIAQENGRSMGGLEKFLIEADAALGLYANAVLASLTLGIGTGRVEVNEAWAVVGRNERREEEKKGTKIDLNNEVAAYFQEIYETPLLEKEEEFLLFQVIRAGKRAATRLGKVESRLNLSERQGLIEMVEQGQVARAYTAAANTRLVVSIAKRYLNRGLPIGDLIQEGNVGLMSAVDEFDHRMGNRFSTFATYKIRQRITRAIAEKSGAVRIPYAQSKKIQLVHDTARRLKDELGGWPTPEEIAEEMGISLKLVRRRLWQGRRPLELDGPVKRGKDTLMGGLIEDEEVRVAKEVEEIDLGELLREVLEAKLTVREMQVLKLRCGLVDGEACTLEEVGNKLGFSREWIRQLEARALNKLRDEEVVALLGVYAESMDLIGDLLQGGGRE